MSQDTNDDKKTYIELRSEMQKLLDLNKSYVDIRNKITSIIQFNNNAMIDNNIWNKNTNYGQQIVVLKPNVVNITIRQNDISGNTYINQGITPLLPLFNESSNLCDKKIYFTDDDMEKCKKYSYKKIDDISSCSSLGQYLGFNTANYNKNSCTFSNNQLITSETTNFLPYGIENNNNNGILVTYDMSNGDTTSTSSNTQIYYTTLENIKLKEASYTSNQKQCYDYSLNVVLSFLHRDIRLIKKNKIDDTKNKCIDQPSELLYYVYLENLIPIQEILNNSQYTTPVKLTDKINKLEEHQYLLYLYYNKSHYFYIINLKNYTKNISPFANDDFLKKMGFKKYCLWMKVPFLSSSEQNNSCASFFPNQNYIRTTSIKNINNLQLKEKTPNNLCKLDSTVREYQNYLHNIQIELKIKYNKILKIINKLNSNNKKDGSLITIRKDIVKNLQNIDMFNNEIDTYHEVSEDMRVLGTSNRYKSIFYIFITVFFIILIYNISKT